MYQFAATLCAGTIATALVGAIAITPTAAEAATTSSADKVALKEATVACKAEAKEKKIRWPASRKYVKNCVARTAVKQAIVACKAEAKGKKIRWPTSRKFVSSCVIAALKDSSIDISLVRRELNLKGLRVYTPEEIGCHQNVFC